MSIDLYPAQFILLDSFPVTVHKFGDELRLTGTEYRVIITDNRLYVLDDSPEGPVALVNEPLESELSGDNKTGYTLTAGGYDYSIKKSAGCGCGSRIRGYHPFLGVPFAARYPKGTV